MIEKAVQGESCECYVTEDTGVAGIMYFKDAVRCIEMIYQAPMEQIKTVNYSVTGLRDRLTARELELSIKKHIPGFSVVYKPDPKVMAIFKGRTLVEISLYSAIAPPYTSLRCCSIMLPAPTLLRSVALYAPVLL